jgi:signal peptidase II
LQAVGGTALNTDEATVTDQPPARRGPLRAALAVLIGTAVLAVVVDQVVKELSTKQLVEGEPVEILWGLIHLSLLRNSGAAFSLGSDFTWVFPLVTVVVVTWIVIMAKRLRSLPWALALGLVLGGALGNLGDRLFRAPGFLHGHVVDMISVFGPYGEYFAVFNIADSCLSVGGVLAVILELTGRQRDGTRMLTKKQQAAKDAAEKDAAASEAGTTAAPAKGDNA